MDKLVESKIANCLACQAVERQTRSTPLKPTEIPENVWDTVNVDYLGPLPNGKYLFVLIDQRSRYPVVDFTKTTDATTAISSLSRTFNLFGNPIYIVSDNGPPFTSQRLKEFLQSRGVSHRKITPLWPQANGEAERFMRPLNKTIRTAHLEGKDIETEVQKYLFAYRNTPHSSTKVSPSEVMFNRKINFNLPQIDNTAETNLQANTNENDRKSKSYNKNYIDTKKRAQDILFKRGDRVLVRQPKENKLTPYSNATPLRVTNVKGTMITAQFENQENGITRHATHFKRIAPSTGLPTTQRNKNEQNTERKQYSLRERKEIIQKLVYKTTNSRLV
uniref:Integrase catalytic domain-containing protein n=1 Tax=Clytia hemisphaerica TaxID=252671 RepID=A0A7M5VG95_9CNID